MIMPKSPYEILGVADTATKDEIKNAYRTLVKTHHPDKGGTVSGFTRIQKAYELLSDQKRRSAYDVLHGLVKNSQQAQYHNANPYRPTWSSPNKFVNQYYQNVMAGNSAPASISSRNFFNIPRTAIYRGQVTSIPAPYPHYGSPTVLPYGAVDEIEVEVDYRIFTNGHPMPNDVVRLEFNHPISSTIDAEVIEAIYSTDSRGRQECRLRVRRASAWQTQP